MLLPYFLDSLVIGNDACQNAPSAFCVGVGDVDATERKRRRHGSKILITLCQRDVPTPLACGVERYNIAGSAYFIVVHGVSPFCMKLQSLAKRCRCLRAFACVLQLRVWHTLLGAVCVANSAMESSIFRFKLPVYLLT